MRCGMRDVKYEMKGEIRTHAPAARHPRDLFSSSSPIRQAQGRLRRGSTIVLAGISLLLPLPLLLK